MRSELGEFRRGWGPLLGATVGAGCGLTSIVFYTHGVFAVAITQSTGWQRGEVQFAFTLMSLMAVMTAPATGLLIDRFDARRVALVSIVGFFLGLALLAFTGDSLRVYYAAFLLLAVLGAGTLPVTWTTVVNRWFHANRGLALAIALSGTGVAATVAPAYAGWLIERVGWQSAYFWLAATTTVIALPLVGLLFRSPPPRADSASRNRASYTGAFDAGGLSLVQALRSYRLWVMCFAIALVAGSVAGLITSFVALITDAGVALVRAAEYASVIGVSVILGRILAGLLVDRLWAPAVAAVLLVCPAAAALALNGMAITPAVAITCAALIGLAAGAEVDLLAFLSSRYFGLRSYGAIYGVTFVFFSVAAGLAPAAFGWVYDVHGTYAPALQFSAAACAVGAVAMLTLGAYPDFDSQAIEK